jgi:hypothetical protein
MPFEARPSLFVVCPVLAISATVRAQERAPYVGPACTRNVDNYFTKEVWPKVASVQCLNCHKPGGDADQSGLVLQDPQKVHWHAQDEAMRHNREAFAAGNARNTRTSRCSS